MVFQNYAIYPHMTRAQEYRLRAAQSSKLPRPEKEKRIEEVAGILGMTELLDRKPASFRAASASASPSGAPWCATRPCSCSTSRCRNLDAQLRTQMRLEIKKLHQRVGTTIVFVTHDQVEAMTMADRIVIMKDGHIQQVGTPAEVYHKPANTFVARFIGAPSMNMISRTWPNGGDGWRWRFGPAAQVC